MTRVREGRRRRTGPPLNPASGRICASRSERGYSSRVSPEPPPAPAPLSLPPPLFFPLVFLISQGGARNNISSQRPYPDSGLEEGTPSAYSFINIYPHLNSHRGPKLSSPPGSLLPRTLPVSVARVPLPHRRVFVLANLLYVSYTDLHL